MEGYRQPLQPHPLRMRPAILGSAAQPRRPAGHVSLARHGSHAPLSAGSEARVKVSDLISLLKHQPADREVAMIFLSGLHDRNHPYAVGNITAVSFDKDDMAMPFFLEHKLLPEILAC